MGSKQEVIGEIKMIVEIHVVVVEELDIVITVAAAVPVFGMDFGRTVVVVFVMMVEDEEGEEKRLNVDQMEVVDGVGRAENVSAELLLLELEFSPRHYTRDVR